MIHIVVITEGTEADKTKAVNFFKTNPGWKSVTPDVWLLASKAAVQPWRDFLAQQIPTLKFLIVRLTGFWGESGLPPVAQWLQGCSRWF